MWYKSAKPYRAVQYYSHWRYELVCQTVLSFPFGELNPRKYNFFLLLFTLISDTCHLAYIKS